MWLVLLSPHVHWPPPGVGVGDAHPISPAGPFSVLLFTLESPSFYLFFSAGKLPPSSSLIVIYLFLEGLVTVQGAGHPVRLFIAGPAVAGAASWPALHVPSEEGGEVTRVQG